MKTLVIHPLDETTLFLKHIYVGKEWTVVTDNIGKRPLRNLIKEHNRIVMLGHGCERGLFDSNFNVVIDAELVQFLREKECVGIWCHAETFFKKYKLKGFCSGMFISDYDEANMFCVNSGASEIDISNVNFAKVLGEHIFKENVLELVKNDYEVINAVTRFNNDSLYIFPELN